MKRLTAALAIGLMLVCAAAVPAEAGTYTVHACKRPDLQPAGFDGWRQAAVGAESFAASYCPGGQAWLLFMRAAKPHPAGDRNEATFSAPADTTIAGYTVWRSVRLLTSGSFDYAYTLAQGARSQVVETCSGRAGCAGRGDPDDPGAESGTFWQLGLRGVRNLWFTIACRGPAACGALTTDSPAKLWIHRADIHLEDNLAPEFAAPPGGPLVESRAPVTGVQSISIAATDRGSGVREAIAEIDGREVARGILDANGGACQEPFTTTVPCKRSVQGALAVDTSQLPDGEHTLRVRIADATRVNVAAWAPITFRTANGCRLEPRAASARITAALAIRRRGRVREVDTATVRRGRRVTLGGTLRTAAGAPIPGAVVCVVAQPEPTGAEPGSYAWLRTDAEGRFAYRLPKGPSRTVYAVHRAADGAAVASVNVRVKASVSLRAERRSLRNGEVLPLKGRVRGGPIPRRGALVEMQARRGTRWQTFGTTRARRGGRFSFQYQFSRTTGVQRYRLRARVPDQSGYPYAAGASRPVVVFVRG